MEKSSAYETTTAKPHARSIWAAVVPYVLLALALAGLFVWRVAVTDPDWDAIPDAAASMNTSPFLK